MVHGVTSKLETKDDMIQSLTILIALIVVGLIGCQEKGPAEKAGERIDEIVDNVKHGDAPLKEKGTMEKLGESIDDSVKQTERRERR